jgi:hypothetical protein
MIVIVDTNVAIVANGKSEQASRICVERCIQRLSRITGDKDRLALDDQWRIVTEYKNKLRSAGEPGAGDAFLKWVLTNLTNRKRCELVKITPINGSDDHFQEFPRDPDLEKFDRSDRKFVAVALAHRKRPPVLQAVDGDWWDARQALERNGVRIKFLCPDDIA